MASRLPTFIAAVLLLRFTIQSYTLVRIDKTKIMV